MVTGDLSLGEGLSMPECEVLLRGPEIGDQRAVSLALKELVAEQALMYTVMVDSRRFGRSQRIGTLTLGPNAAASFSRPLRVILDLVGDPRASAPRVIWWDGPTAEEELRRRTGAEIVRSRSGPDQSLSTTNETIQDGIDAGQTTLARPPAQRFFRGAAEIPVVEVARAVFQRYAYVHGVVMAALVERGLCVAKHERRLHVFRTTRWVLTREGARLKERLKFDLAYGAETELVSRAGFLGDAAAFAAIDADVERGWILAQPGD